jgi:hypothetical protein
VPTVNERDFRSAAVLPARGASMASSANGTREQRPLGLFSETVPARAGVPVRVRPGRVGNGVPAELR